MSRIRRLLILVLLAVGSASCDWISLAANALTYRTTAPGEAGNVAIHGGFAYVTAAEEGLRLIEAGTGQTKKTLPPPSGTESVDDVAAADGLLFLLDARAPGRLSVLSLADPEAPSLVSGPVPVPVGPFSGVSAAGGRVVVSGGTSELTLRTYDTQGHLGRDLATADLGRGQPDVLLDASGSRAVVSTHTWGPYFGLTLLDLNAPPAAPVAAAMVELQGAGFTAGGAKPANFPIESAWEGDTLLVASARGLSVFDLGGEAPRLVTTIDLGFEAVNVDVSNGLAAVVGSKPSPVLAFVDVRVPGRAAVTRTVRLEPGTYPTGVALGEEGAVVAAHEKGVLFFKR